jgi:GT2 family glycosyltransferase
VQPPDQPLTLTVAIVTWRRPQFVQGSLEAIGRLDPPPQQVLVVDASEDTATADVVAAFPWAERVSFPGGAGHMTRARNEALLHARGDVIAFLDDDAYVRPDWSTQLLATYADAAVGAVAGRTCNGDPGEDTTGVEKIGRLLPDGRLTGFFAADPGRIIAVDHGIGANMSFRRTVLAELGGFRDDYPGTALREDSDMFLRVTALGRVNVFNPFAAVDHVSAPHVRGRRFDWRYMFWGRHNHVLLLARQFGLRSPLVRSWIRREVRDAHRASGAPRLRKLVRIALAWTALIAGVATSLRKCGLGPVSPVRSDQLGQEIRAHLGRQSEETEGTAT